MTEGTMIAFKMHGKISQTRLNKFCREFYGYTDRSNKGKYLYRRKGFLDEIPHLNPIRSLLIVWKNNAEKVISFLEEYDAEIYTRDIILTDEDKENLRVGD